MLPLPLINFGLRDYRTATWEGGNSDCDHILNPSKTKKFGNPEFNVNRPSREETKMPGYYYAGVCGKCGATQVDKQIGIEKTPEEYVSNLVEIFEEVKRVLRDDGTLWLNIGDCYNGSGGAGGDYNSGGLREGQPKYGPKKISTLKPKDLIGIPWALAFALRDNGWYLRCDICWTKANPTPESVRDRPTRSHEFIFLLAKSQRYFYDHEAIKEPVSEAMVKAAKRKIIEDKQYKHDEHVRFGKRSPNRAWSDEETLARIVEGGRNKRDVWNVNTKPSPEAHFAVFSEELILPCILAGSSSHVCGSCGTPWKRISELVEKGTARDTTAYSEQLGGKSAATKKRGGISPDRKKTIGYEPNCDCKPAKDNGYSIVLDPFCGTGTTGVVSVKNHRHFVGIELSEKYYDMALKKMADVQTTLF